MLQEIRHCIWLRQTDIQVCESKSAKATADAFTEAIKFLVSVTIQPPTDNPVSGLLQSSSMLVNVPNSSGNTSLHWAALNGHLEAVKLLVDSGADVLAKNNAGHDVAYEAELAGKEVVVNWLLGAQKDDCILEKEEEEEEEDVEIQEGVTQNGYASAG